MMTLTTRAFVSDQREASPPTNGQRGRAVGLRASALFYVGVGEGDDLSVGALQLDGAVCGAHLLAAWARVHHGGGHLRVAVDESEILISQQRQRRLCNFRGFWIVGSGGGDRMSSYVV